jgi:hypothetical protein
LFLKHKKKVLRCSKYKIIKEGEREREREREKERRAEGPFRI